MENEIERRRYGFSNSKNTNQTIAQLLRNFFYQVAGDTSYQIAASHGGVVTVNGSN